MSKAPLMITAVAVEERTQAEVARAYRISRNRVSKLIARYRPEGDSIRTALPPTKGLTDRMGVTKGPTHRSSKLTGHDVLTRYATALGGRLHQSIYFDDGDIAAIA